MEKPRYVKFQNIYKCDFSQVIKDSAKKITHKVELRDKNMKKRRRFKEHGG